MIASSAEARPLLPRSRLAALGWFGVVALAVVAMFGPMQRATFALIDDHQIASWVLQPKPAGWATPIMEPVASGEQGRWRPGFWALWGLEATLAGDRPFVWHLDRLLLALAAAGALFGAASALLSARSAALVALLLFCGFHSEVWMRLKVQEAYATPVALAGVAILVWRLRDRSHGPATLWPGLALLAMAGTIKESFVPLLPAALVLVTLIDRWRGEWQSDSAVGEGADPKPRWDARDRRAVALFLALAVAEALFVLHTRWRHGSVYDGTLTVTGIVATAVRHSWWITKDSGWVVPAAAAGLVLARSRAPRALRVYVGLLTAAVATLLVPQWVIYGSDPLESRYLLPGHLFACFAAALGLWILETRRARALLVASVLALCWFAGKWMLRDHELATRRAAETHVFQDTIAVAADMHRRSGQPFVFRTDDPWDYEPIHSAWLFLRYRLGHSPRAFLVVSATRPSRRQVLNERLATALARESAEGSGRFEPLARLDPNAGCIEVTFRAPPEPAWCETRVQIPAPE